MNTKFMNHFLITCLLAIGFSIPVNAIETQTAVIATTAQDWSSGAHSIISVDPIGGPRGAQNSLAPSGSDLTVVSYDKYFYRMERSGAHNITKYDVNEPDTPIWQFSTEGNEANSNPHDLVFVNEEKAYLIRYGSDKAWIVNPSAASESAFKTGELDLSNYSDDDGTPEMDSGIIVGNMLFITLQRIDTSGGWGNYKYNTPYISVFDTITDEEIDIQNCECDLKGIVIEPIFNLLTIQYVDEANRIYVQGVGNWDQTNADVSGGIVQVNPATYETEVILLDSPAYGAVSGMTIVSGTKGYFVGYAGWGNNTLYSFDPSCGCDVEAVDGFENISISGMQSGVYTDKNAMLWVCNQSSSSVDILNTVTDTVDESVATGLNPSKVVFCSQGSPDEDNGDGSGSSGCFISTID
jgi:YVTN family beta-propeller protein